MADKPDSMEICFIPDGDYAAWLDRRGNTPPPGDFVSPDGTVLGRHKGIHHYTLGQGRGLGVSGPHRYFVSAIRPERNQVVLSDGGDLGRRELLCTAPNWIAVEALTAPMAVTVRLRHSRTEQRAVILPEGGCVRVRMDQPAAPPRRDRWPCFTTQTPSWAAAGSHKAGRLLRAPLSEHLPHAQQDEQKPGERKGVFAQQPPRRPRAQAVAQGQGGQRGQEVSQGRPVGVQAGSPRGRAHPRRC